MKCFLLFYCCYCFSNKVYYPTLRLKECPLRWRKMHSLSQIVMTSLYMKLNILVEGLLMCSVQSCSSLVQCALADWPSLGGIWRRSLKGKGKGEAKARQRGIRCWPVKRSKSARQKPQAAKRKWGWGLGSEPHRGPESRKLPRGGKKSKVAAAFVMEITFFISYFVSLPGSCGSPSHPGSIPVDLIKKLGVARASIFGLWLWLKGPLVFDCTYAPINVFCVGWVS